MTRTLLLVLCLTTTLHADTILKFNLGTAGEDFRLADGLLTTINDGNVLSIGEQDTNVNFTGILSGMTDIPTEAASFTLSGVQIVDDATVIGGAVVVQSTTGGTLDLWDDSNNLLLSGSLNNGSISGALGPAATGSFFNLDFATVTGGWLAPLLDPESLSFAISFTDVNHGSGFSVSDTQLAPFEAAGTANISAIVPEPSTTVPALLGLMGIMLVRRRR